MSLSDVNAGPRVEEGWHQPLQHQGSLQLTPHLPLEPASVRAPVSYAGEKCEEGGGKAVNAASIHDWPGHSRCSLSLAARTSGRRIWFARPRAMQCLRAARYKRTQKAQEVFSLGASGANPNDLKAEWPRVERSSFGDPKERIEPTLLSYPLVIRYNDGTNFF